jgi:dolichol kinase
MILALLNASILWIYGIVMFIHLARGWNDPKKKTIRYSEIVYGIAFFIIGYLTYMLFENENLSESNENLLHGLMLIAFLLINVWLLLGNVLPNYLKVKKNPDLIENDPVFTRKYDVFLDMLEKKYSKNNSDDIIKDLTRKALHFVILALLVGFHELSFYLVDSLAERGLTPIAFRNFLLILTAMFFVMMFFTADMVRINKFEYLPLWARKWYLKSLENRSEAWTLISSVPFLLTLGLFIYSDVHVFFSAAIISCVADAVASIVGKSYGKHKMKKFGRYPHKSFEGLLAGALVSFVGVISLFFFYPIPGISLYLVATCGLACAIAFVYIDAFAELLCDNILNSLVPGVIVWALLSVFL